MSDDMRLAVACLQEAVDQELKFKAKLGYKAVILGKDGKPQTVSARTLVRQRNSLKEEDISA